MESGNGAVTLRLYGALRQAAGDRDVRLTAGAKTVGDALAQFAALKGRRVAELIFDRTGKVWGSLILLVNDEPADLGEASPVSSGDVISILMPLAGG